MKFRELRADEIDARVSTIKKNGCSLLLYKDARCDMNILDECIGSMDWQRSHEIIGGNLYCTVSIRDNTDGTWVSKQDVGTESYTEKEKGQASDSFKRACFNWGIGRELYTAPFIWIKAGDVTIDDKGGGKYTTYDRFKVKEIGYTDRKITHLVIVNASQKGKIVYSMGSATEPQEKINEREAKVLKKLLADKGLPNETYDKTPIDDLSPEQYANAMNFLKTYKEAE